mmetsp:Transcript_8060/g.23938  ORF Transcript_8060/g.23938 Transcript_8060/m.23938 type:complete len:331 (-) Transcript_8060:1119-2111(-)
MAVTGWSLCAGGWWLAGCQRGSGGGPALEEGAEGPWLRGAGGLFLTVSLWNVARSSSSVSQISFSSSICASMLRCRHWCSCCCFAMTCLATPICSAAHCCCTLATCGLACAANCPPSEAEGAEGSAGGGRDRGATELGVPLACRLSCLCSSGSLESHSVVSEPPAPADACRLRSCRWLFTWASVSPGMSIFSCTSVAVTLERPPRLATASLNRLRSLGVHRSLCLASPPAAVFLVVTKTSSMGDCCWGEPAAAPWSLFFCGERECLYDGGRLESAAAVSMRRRPPGVSGVPRACRAEGDMGPMLALPGQEAARSAISSRAGTLFWCHMAG